MTKSTVEKLSHEKIQQLLDAVGAKAREDTSHDLAVVDFDWRQPRYLNLQQRTKANEFAEAVAQQCVKELSRLYQDQCKVSVLSTQERFSRDFDEQEAEQGYYIPFGPDSNQLIGLVSIPKTTALLWTTMVLGGTEDQADTERKLSKLEETFLQDIAAGLINGFASVYGSALNADRLVVPSESSFTLNGSEELFEITFQSSKSESDKGAAQASFLVCCDKLEPVTGKTSSQGPKLSEAQIKNVIRQHVEQVPISVHVRLGTTRLAFKDVMDLQVNDIVVLDKNIAEPVEILVENRTLFHGYPAQSGGRYAVVIA